MSIHFADAREDHIPIVGHSVVEEVFDVSRSNVSEIIDVDDFVIVVK
jgi:hypothetical protein